MLVAPLARGSTSTTSWRPSGWSIVANACSCSPSMMSQRLMRSPLSRLIPIQLHCLCSQHDGAICPHCRSNQGTPDGHLVRLPVDHNGASGLHAGQGVFIVDIPVEREAGPL